MFVLRSFGMDNQSKMKEICIRVLFVTFFLITWEIVSKSKVFGVRSDLIFPSVETIAVAFIENFRDGYAGISVMNYICNSMFILAKGLGIGIVLSFCLSGLAMINRFWHTIYDFIVNIFDLLPGVAVLPVVIIMFGISSNVIVFLVVHAVIWPMSRNLMDGFQSVPRIYIECGKNIGLKGMSLLTGIYLPASITYIVSGIKVSWARAWRGLISAEMIFGIVSRPGIGLYINQMRVEMKNAQMYAVLIVIIMIGIIVQYGIISPLEKHTVKKWGMIR